MRTAAIILDLAGEEVVGVRIAASSDHVVDAGAVFVEPVRDRVLHNRRERAHVRHVRPEPITHREMSSVQRACLAREEPFGWIVRIPTIHIGDLRTLRADDAPQPARRHLP